jgi:hypothetical protein
MHQSIHQHCFKWTYVAVIYMRATIIFAVFALFLIAFVTSRLIYGLKLPDCHNRQNQIGGEADAAIVAALVLLEWVKRRSPSPGPTLLMPAAAIQPVRLVGG